MHGGLPKIQKLHELIGLNFGFPAYLNIHSRRKKTLSCDHFVQSCILKFFLNSLRILKLLVAGTLVIFVLVASACVLHLQLCFLQQLAPLLCQGRLY